MKIYPSKDNLNSLDTFNPSNYGTHSTAVQADVCKVQDLMHVAVAVDRVETASLVRWLGLCPVWDQNGGQTSVYFAVNITNTVCKLVWF